MTSMPMRARGFSLIEFMIAMTIGLFLVAGLVYLIAETSRSRAEIERSSRQIENGRYAIDRIAEDLRHAGFLGTPTDPEDSTFPVATSLTALPTADLCTPTGIVTGEPGLAIPIQAYDGGASLPVALGCLSGLMANYQPNTDILVVRRASTAAVTKAVAADVPSGNANRLFVQTGRESVPSATDYFVHKLATGSPSATFTLQRLVTNETTLQDAPLYRYFVRIYFVSSVDDTGAAMPTLKVLELDAGASGPEFKVLSVADGIEQLRFDFGLDEDTGTGFDGVPNCMVRFTKCNGAALVTAADQLAHWSNIVGVQVNLVARNGESSPSYTDDKTYSLGLKGYTTAANDPYRRHSYSTFVRLHNVAMPRE